MRRISLFASLDDDEIAQLAASIAQRRFEAGDVVIEKDAPGDSMFFVVEGLLYVLAAVDGRAEPLRVGQIGAGAFFGEMSLLTGEPRSATLCAATETVAFEITRDDLRDLFARRPEVVKQIAKVVAQRQAQRSDALDRATADEVRAETASLSERIFERITRLFGGADRRSA